jgi:hypothetical protein
MIQRMKKEKGFERIQQEEHEKDIQSSSNSLNAEEQRLNMDKYMKFNLLKSKTCKWRTLLGKG